jgi:hypothetical protein
LFLPEVEFVQAQEKLVGRKTGSIGRTSARTAAVPGDAVRGPVTAANAVTLSHGIGNQAFSQVLDQAASGTGTGIGSAAGAQPALSGTVQRAAGSGSGDRLAVQRMQRRSRRDGRGRREWDDSDFTMRRVGFDRVISNAGGAPLPDSDSDSEAGRNYDDAARASATYTPTYTQLNDGNAPQMGYGPNGYTMTYDPAHDYGGPGNPANANTAYAVHEHRHILSNESYERDNAHPNAHHATFFNQHLPGTHGSGPWVASHQRQSTQAVANFDGLLSRAQADRERLGEGLYDWIARRAPYGQALPHAEYDTVIVDIMTFINQSIQTWSSEGRHRVRSTRTYRYLSDMSREARERMEMGGPSRREIPDASRWRH